MSVQPLPFLVHKTLRVFANESEFVRLALPLPPSPWLASEAPGASRAAAAAARAALAAAALGPGSSASSVSGSTRTSVAGPYATLHGATASGQPLSTTGLAPAGLGQFVHCPETNVVLDSRDDVDALGHRVVRLRHRCDAFPTVSSFHLFLFNDPFCARLHEVWRVCVHSMLRCDVHATVGETVTSELLLRGDLTPRRVRLFSSDPAEIQFEFTGAFVLSAGAYNRVRFSFTPLVEGARTALIHVVDVDSKELVSAWRVTAVAAAPIVTKEYDLVAVVGEESHKRIEYVNQWEQEKTFTVRSSDPSLVWVKNPRLTLAPGAADNIRFFVRSAFGTGVRETLLFIDEENGRNEESIRLRISFVA